MSFSPKNSLNFFALFALTLSAILLCDNVFAQAVPSNVSPDVTQRRFDSQRETRTPSNLGLPSIPGEDTLSAKERQQLEQKLFTLKTVRFDGATAFSQDALKFSYEGLVGKKVSLADLQGIAKAVTDHYRKAGYTLSQAVLTQQNIKSGTVTIRVVEGYIGSILIEGDISEGEKEILRGYADNIKSSSPVRIQDMERYMLLMNDLPGSTVSGLLRPSASQVGSADLVLTASKKTFDGAYTFDNRGSKYIGPFQHSLSLGANSVLGMYDRTQFRFSTAHPIKSLQSYEVQHEQHIGSEGTTAGITLAQTNTNPQDTLAPLQIVGESTLYSARASHPFIRLRQESLIGRASFDARDTKTDIFNNVHFTKDRLRAIRVGGAYNVMDDFFGSLKGNNLFDAQLSQGLDIFDATTSGTNRSNANGDATFTKFNFNASRTQSLPHNFSFYASGSAQYSDTPLLVSEQYGLGGQDFASAFDPAELLGDQALAGKIELRYNQFVGEQYFNNFQAFTYYDAGKVWLLKAAPGANTNTVLSSVGFGVRTNFTENFSGTAEASFPLEKPTVDQTSYRYEPRVFFSATARF